MIYSGDEIFTDEITSGPADNEDCCPWCGVELDDPFIGGYDANLEAHASDDPCEGMRSEGIGA